MSLAQRDSQLITQACQGDKEAFGDLYELVLEEVYRYIFFRVNVSEEAEDLTEQVFLKAWENLSSCNRRKDKRGGWGLSSSSPGNEPGENFAGSECPRTIMII